MRSLAAEPALTASRLAGALPITRQAVAKHLAALERAGLVEPRRAGRETRYRLTPEPLDEAMAWMAAVGARLGRAARAARRARGRVRPTGLTPASGYRAERRAPSEPVPDA